MQNSRFKELWHTCLGQYCLYIHCSHLRAHLCTIHIKINGIRLSSVFCPYCTLLPQKVTSWALAPLPWKGIAGSQLWWDVCSAASCLLWAWTWLTILPPLIDTFHSPAFLLDANSLSFLFASLSFRVLSGDLYAKMHTDMHFSLGWQRGYWWWIRLGCQRNECLSSNINVLSSLFHEALYYACSHIYYPLTCAYFGTKSSTVQSPPQKLETLQNNFRTIQLLFIVNVSKTVGE